MPAAVPPAAAAEGCVNSIADKLQQDGKDTVRHMLWWREWDQPAASKPGQSASGTGVAACFAALTAKTPHLHLEAKKGEKCASVFSALALDSAGQSDVSSHRGRMPGREAGRAKRAKLVECVAISSSDMAGHDDRERLCTQWR